MKSKELKSTPDLVVLAGRARDAGLEVSLIERPMPDATSVLAVGKRLDIISTPTGVRAESSTGELIDSEAGDQPLLAAQRLWNRLAPELGDSGQLPGTGAIAVGGFAFSLDHEPSSPWQGFSALRWRVPQLALTRSRGRSFLWGEEDLLDLPPGIKASSAARFKPYPLPPPEQWQQEIQSAIDQLRTGRAAKVMLARQLQIQANGVLEAANIAHALRSTYPACFTYLLSGDDGSALVGASPELLLRRRGQQVTTQPMAGSTARGSNEQEDQLLAEQLLASKKNRGEHLITAQQVAERLQPFCEKLEREEPEIIRLTNLQHLATTIKARLKDPPAGLLELAAALHPTPAVNGHPDAEAHQLINELENWERGWYAGAVGWLDTNGDGELAVVLRCGLLTPEGALLYSGVGIMPDSDPAIELTETNLKLQAFLGALGAS